MLRTLRTLRTRIRPGLMSSNTVESLVKDIKLSIKRSSIPVPVGISNRHLHLSREDFKTLFGRDAEPTLLRQLVQPVFFACHEKVLLEGSKGIIENVRLIGPYRPQTQIEISVSDAVVLGLNPPVRDSGALKGSPGVMVKGPAGTVRLSSGVILAKRHIHFNPDEARLFEITDGMEVRVRCGLGGDRELVFEKVLCRVSNKFKLEFHLDIEETNAAMVKNGDVAYIVGI